MYIIFCYGNSNRLNTSHTSLSLLTLTLIALAYNNGNSSFISRHQSNRNITMMHNITKREI